MKKVNKRYILLFIFLTVIFGSIFCGENPLKGKDFVKLGALQTISGNLYEKDAEWFLKTGKKSINLHFGPKEFLESKKVSLTEKKDFTVTGFLYETNLTVLNFVFNDSLVALRTEAGEPLWKNTEFSNKSSVENIQKNVKKSYIVDGRKCIGCNLCVVNCPVKAIVMVDGKAVIDAEKCTNCGICVNGNNSNFIGCPVEAISKDQ